MSTKRKPAKPATTKRAPRRKEAAPQAHTDVWAMMYCAALAGSFSPVDAQGAADHGLAAYMAKFFTAEAVGQ